MVDVIRCPACGEKLEVQPVVDLCIPYYCPGCDTCWGYTVLATFDVDPGEVPKLHRLDRKPMHRVTKVVGGKRVEFWKPGAPRRKTKPSWFKVRS